MFTADFSGLKKQLQEASYVVLIIFFAWGDMASQIFVPLHAELRDCLDGNNGGCAQLCVENGQTDTCACRAGFLLEGLEDCVGEWRGRGTVRGETGNTMGMIPERDVQGV